AFEVGRLQWIRQGRDVAIVVMGSLAVEAHAAVELLAQAGIDCALAVAASIRPAPLADLQRVVAQVPLVLTAEAHYIDGGLGSLVSEVVAEQGAACKVLRAGVRHMPAGASGKQAYLYEAHGLTSYQL